GVGGLGHAGGRRHARRSRDPQPGDGGGRPGRGGRRPRGEPRVPHPHRLPRALARVPPPPGGDVTLARLVAQALAEDLGPLGDITSALLPPDAKAQASVVPRAPGVLAGCDAAAETFRQVDPSLVVTWLATDGEEVAAGQPVATVDGRLASILTAERTAL